MGLPDIENFILQTSGKILIHLLLLRTNKFEGRTLVYSSPTEHSNSVTCLDKVEFK